MAVRQDIVDGGGLDVLEQERREEEEQEPPIIEMFNMFPHESGIVMRRGVELGMICSAVLIAHCAYIIAYYWPKEGLLESNLSFFDRLLLLLCVIRVVAAIPRPFFWFKTRKLFVEARYEPTPQLVAQRLIDIYSHPFRVERWLLWSYYIWLGFTTALLWLTPGSVSGPSELARALWKHVMMNLASIILHRVACVSLFYWLMESDFKRGIPADVLEKYSKVETFIPGCSLSPCNTSKDNHLYNCGECSICYCGYEKGDQVRVLCCGHSFHADCVDTWLVGHQNRCPLCLRVVGPSFDDGIDRQKSDCQVGNPGRH
ncbi:hypothetical protein FOL47_000034 [Perkinsus chesapeaki]|uniref:RING-type domain-containing protein n=1 Tax=Perkinsus chesapeaki TaxID=330153 RepID=A0A7J6N370_PERCH|nr:hypothetical protein FOL47_000034 [Perkinsus chesapeaki]